MAILRYHSIQDPGRNFYAVPSIVISPKEFERHVRYFTKRYNVISMDEVVDCIREGRQFPENAIVFTFDDGYADNYIAYKILKKYGATGTFYLVVGCIGDEQPLWLAEVYQLIKFTTKGEFEVEVDGENHRFRLTDSNRYKVMRDLMWLIKSNDLETRARVMDQLRSQLKWDEVRSKLPDLPVMLSWDQVREMVQNGMTIGGHTMSHANLPNAKPEEAYREVQLCKQTLERKLGIEVKHFSYPNGGCDIYFSEKTEGYIKEIGFLSAVTSEEGLVAFSDHYFSLRRVRVGKLNDVLYRIA